MTNIRILIVDDFEPYRRFVITTLQQRPEFQIVGQASDGLEAVQKAKELQPDLILLDIGLPMLNGIEVAKRTQKVAPGTKILFVSQEISFDIAQETLNMGALGYVHKTRAHKELLFAIDTVLQGRQFIGSGLRSYDFGQRPTVRPPRRHELKFCSDAAGIADAYASFIGESLNAQNVAIMFAPTSTQENVLQRLRLQGQDVCTAIEAGKLTLVSISDGLDTFMVNETPDADRYFKSVDPLIESALKVAESEHPRVALCGEMTGALWAAGKTDAAIRLEQLADELTKRHDCDVLCPYPIGFLHGQEGDQFVKQICEAHSAVFPA